MTTEVHDQNARDLAIDPARSIILQAPAGSGKTGLLVRRYLGLLQHVAQPEEILAITFTRKATAEMRERILDALNKVASGQGFDNHESDLQQVATQAYQRNVDMGWQILNQGQRLNVKTIDGLCAHIVQRMPWASRFGAAPALADDVEPLLQEAALATLEHLDDHESELGLALQELLRQFDGNFARLRDQIASHLNQRQHWQPLLFGDDSLNDTKQLERNWQQYISSVLAECDGLLSTGHKAQLPALMAHAQQTLTEAKKINSIGQTIIASPEWTQFPAPSFKALTQWKSLAALLLVAKGVRKSVTVAVGFAANEKLKKAEISQILADLTDDPAAYAALDHVRCLPSAQFTTPQTSALNATVAVLKRALAELYLTFQRRGQADFTEITLRAIEALGDDCAPSDLALALDHRLSHVLMDEFQDTSPVQLRLLELLTSGWQANDGRSLFLVGDPMQSIYRFRQADVRVFLQARAHGIQDKALDALDLRTNFRSSPAVVNWVNTHFPAIMSQHDEPESGAISYCQATPFWTEQALPGHVQAHQLDAADDATDTAVLGIIQQALANNPDHSIAVLGRKRKQLYSIAEALHQNGIPFEAVELEPLSAMPITDDLLSLLRWLLQPFDRIAAAAVLRAPWCGLLLADLSLVFADKTQAVEQVWHNTELVNKLSDDGQSRFTSVAQRLSPVLNDRGQFSWAQLVHRAWSALEGNRLYPSYQLDYAQLFFAELARAEAQEASFDLTAFTLRLEKIKISLPEAPVKLMTLHKAKGLEFDTVIVPGLEQIQSNPNFSTPLLDSIQADHKLLVSPFATNNKRETSHKQYLAYLNKLRDQYETQRLLYVACTRAKCSLHLVAAFKFDSDGQAKAASASSLLACLQQSERIDWQPWPTNVSELVPEQVEPVAHDAPKLIRLSQPLPLISTAKQGTGTAQAKSKKTALTLAPIAAAQALETASESKLIDDTSGAPLNDKINRYVGLAYHALVEGLMLEQLPTWLKQLNAQRLMQALIAQQTPAQWLQNGTEQLLELCQKTATDEHAKWVFSADHQQIKCEWALTVRGKKTENVIVDRTFIDAANKRWIIDFKTSQPREAEPLQQFLAREQHNYQSQLTNYARIIQLMHTERQEIGLALYFPYVNECLKWDATIGM